MEYEKFYAKIWKQGESLVITIPFKIAAFAGWKLGDDITILARKEKKKIPTEEPKLDFSGIKQE